MHYEKGNIVIVILLIVVVGVIVTLINYKMKYLKNNTQTTVPKVQEMDEKIKNHLMNQSNAPVILYDGEVLNPFNTNASIQVVHLPNSDKNSKTPDTQLQTSNQSQQAKATNASALLPDGKPIPLQDGYLAEYPVRFNNGKISVIIDNTMNKSNLIVYLYHLRDLNIDEKHTKPELASAALISAGYTFNFDNLKSGHYQLRWLVLSDNKAYENPPFTIYQDNKYVYDRVFTFKETDNLEKIKAIEINAKEILN